MKLSEQTFTTTTEKGELKDFMKRNNFENYFSVYTNLIKGEVIKLKGYSFTNFYKKVNGVLNDVFFWEEGNKFIIPANEGVFEIDSRFYLTTPTNLNK